LVLRVEGNNSKNLVFLKDYVKVEIVLDILVCLQGKKEVAKDFGVMTILHFVVKPQGILTASLFDQRQSK